MNRSRIRAEQIYDADLVTEAEHGELWAHENLVVSGTLTVTGTGGVQIPEDSYMYYGDPTVSGSWRTGISGEDFVYQKYNGSAWETKKTIEGTGEEDPLLI